MMPRIWGTLFGVMLVVGLFGLAGYAGAETLFEGSEFASYPASFWGAAAGVALGLGLLLKVAKERAYTPRETAQFTEIKK